MARSNRPARASKQSLGTAPGSILDADRSHVDYASSDDGIALDDVRARMQLVKEYGCTLAEVAPDAPGATTVVVGRPVTPRATWVCTHVSLPEPPPIGAWKQAYGSRPEDIRDVEGKVIRPRMPSMSEARLSVPDRPASQAPSVWRWDPELGCTVPKWHGPDVEFDDPSRNLLDDEAFAAALDAARCAREGARFTNEDEARIANGYLDDVRRKLRGVRSIKQREPIERAIALLNKYRDEAIRRPASQAMPAQELSPDTRFDLFARIRARYSRDELADAVRAIGLAEREFPYRDLLDPVAVWRRIDRKLERCEPIANLPGLARQIARSVILDELKKRRLRTVSLTYENGVEADVVDERSAAPVAELPTRADFAEVVEDQAVLTERLHARAVGELSHVMKRAWYGEDTDTVRAAFSADQPRDPALRRVNLPMLRIWSAFGDCGTDAQIAAVAIVAGAAPQPKPGVSTTQAFERVGASVRKLRSGAGAWRFAFCRAICRAAMARKTDARVSSTLRR